MKEWQAHVLIFIAGFLVDVIFMREGFKRVLKQHGLWHENVADK